MSFKVAQLDAGHTPVVEEKVVADGEEFLRGALLVESSGEWTECGADPADVDAVAESDYGADTGGFGGHGKKEFPPGYMQGTRIEGTYFRAQYIGTKPAATGGVYGVVKDTDDLWKVDFDETTNTRVRFVKDLTLDPPGSLVNEVLVQFLAVADFGGP